MAARQPLAHHVGGCAEVEGESHLNPLGGKGIAHRVCRVVVHREGLHLNIPLPPRIACTKHPGIGQRPQFLGQMVAGAGGEEDRQLVLSRQRAQPTHMVTMLVGYQHGIEAIQGEARHLGATQ